MAGPIDVCVVGTDGSVTVVECKLASNSERRRMVIGQVVDYASAIWDAGIDQFLASFDARSGVDLREALDHEALTRLTAGITEARIDLCLAVDQIDDDLRRLVEYLNRASHPDIAVTALQLGYARHAGVEILIPATFGGELAAAKAPPPQGLRWSEERLLEECTDAVDRRFIERLFRLSESAEPNLGSNAPVWFGAYPGGGVFFHPAGAGKAPFQVWVNSEHRAILLGNWTQYPSISGHDGFALIAEALGQDHRNGREGVPVADLDVETLWAAATSSAALLPD